MPIVFFYVGGNISFPRRTFPIAQLRCLYIQFDDMFREYIFTQMRYKRDKYLIYEC